MTNAERQAREMLNQLDSFDEDYDMDSVAKRPIGKLPNVARIGKIAGNPTFKAQFNLNVSVTYCNVTDSLMVAPADLPSSLQVANPVYFFGNIDKASFYKNAENKLPISTAWNFSAQSWRVKNTDSVMVEAPIVKKGDLYQNFSKTVGGKEYVCTVSIHCPQTPYGSFLEAISSDTFIINMVRYKVDKTNTDQFQNQLHILKLSLFGKVEHDTIDPNTYITSGTFQDNIADIPLQLKVDKNLVVGTYINYNCTNLQLIFTVLTANKI